LVERGPEKAGVGGSIPSLATNNFNNLQIAKSRVKTSSRVQYAYIGCCDFTFGAARSNDLHTSRAVLLLGISSSKTKNPAPNKPCLDEDSNKTELCTWLSAILPGGLY
jgi:hypothetical protein